jgi:hypothetical protein
MFPRIPSVERRAYVGITDPIKERPRLTPDMKYFPFASKLYVREEHTRRGDGGHMYQVSIFSGESASWQAYQGGFTTLPFPGIELQNLEYGAKIDVIQSQRRGTDVPV